MSLPYIFASVTTITTPQLDANFAALGALTPIPCSLSGTNDIVLTPLTNTPSVTAYQNYMQFTGIASATSTGDMTAQIGALDALNIFVDTSGGPVRASSGSIVINTSFILMYDSTLDSGSGGFHLISTLAVGAYLPLTGGTLSGALTAPSATVTGNLKSASVTITGALAGATLAGTSLVTAPTISSASLISGVSTTLSGNITTAGLKAGSGNTITNVLRATPSIVFGSLAPQATSDQTVAMVGVVQTDVLSFGVPSAPTAGIGLYPFVTAADTVIMRAFNYTTLTLSPPAGVYPITAVRTA